MNMNDPIQQEYINTRSIDNFVQSSTPVKIQRDEYMREFVKHLLKTKYNNKEKIVRETIDIYKGYVSGILDKNVLFAKLKTNTIEYLKYKNKKKAEEEQQKDMARYRLSQ